MSQDVSQDKKTRYKTPPLIIQDQFGIIQNLQVSPIPQSSFLPWPFFAQQDGSSTQFKSMQYLNDFHNWIKIVMTEIILTMCLSSLKNIYVKLFFMEDRAHEFYWAHFIFDQPSLARTLRDCHYYQHLIILSSLNCPWLPFISFDNLSTLSQVLRLMHPH